MTSTQPRTVPVGQSDVYGRRSTNLDGEWAFVAGDVVDLAAADTRPIIVPGLWEAQGWRELDGYAWYQREFELDDVTGHWTLRFGAVMDEADVYVNGVFVGRHALAFTPFALDVTDNIRAGRNHVAVRVLDVVADTPEHLRTAHGKQGWKNDVFPSPPSLYMSYGGIWQSVTLERHGALTIEDPFVNGDPANPVARLTIRNRGTAVQVVVECVIGDSATREEILVGDGESIEVCSRPYLDALPRWSPGSPSLHVALFRLLVDGVAMDERTVRFGVRTVEVAGDRILLNGRPLRIQAALVQGFRGDTLYAEGSRKDIEEEVRAAKAIGLNTLRLHIKAFDPVYLDVCDELGMLVHCDLPIAEPIAVDEMDDTGALARHCATAVAEQVTRDRNHPSIVLWSVMNEIGAEDLSRDTRATPGYERFVNMLYQIVTDVDGTRPIIENDFIEPGAGAVYRSPVLTAHWYGRLSRDYLRDLLRRCETNVYPYNVFLVSEFGDWALPSLNRVSSGEAPFWWPTRLEDEIATLPWPGSVDDFVTGTHAYKGISDRLQIEIFRRTPGVGGWCLTELTDVPHEYNGLWDVDRRAKPEVLRQIAAACRTTVPMALSTVDGHAGTWSGWAGELLRLSVTVAHDGDDELTGQVRASFENIEKIEDIEGLDGSLEATLRPHGPTPVGELTLRLPELPGDHVLTLAWTAAGETVHNRYTVHVAARTRVTHAVTVLGSAADRAAVARAGGIDRPARLGGPGVLVVGEGALSADSASVVSNALREGRDVLVLAQPVSAVGHLPVAARMADVTTEWGSIPYVFSTAETALSAVAPGTVVTTELLSVTADVVYTSLDCATWPPHLMLGMYKPAPGGLTGSVVASLPVGAARLWLCQLPLVDAISHDDATATATLSDLFRAIANGRGAS